MKTYFLSHPTCLQHKAGEQHPERPQRLEAIFNLLEQRDIAVEKRSAQQVNNEYLSYAHSAQHVEKVLNALGKSVVFDADTRTSPQSVDAALYAAGAAVEAVDLVLDNPQCTAFCAVRPPGHHAESNRAMGFCLFNSVAIAAAYAIKHKGLDRILIFDPDVHHGNGTEEIFYERSDVVYVSIHQSPLYPGTGRAEDRGAADGLGFNYNYPLRSGEGDETYIFLAQTSITDIIKNYQPQLIIFSAGFDAHKLDPLASMDVTTSGFCQMYSVIMKHALAAQIPFFYYLEGGYSLEGLSSSVALLLETITSENWPNIEVIKPSSYIREVIKRIK